MKLAVADDFVCLWALCKDIKAPERIRNRKRDLTQSQSGKMHVLRLCYLHYTVNWSLEIPERHTNTNVHEKHPKVWLQLQGKAWEAGILNSSLWWKNLQKMILEHNTDRFMVYFGLSKDRQHVTWQECNSCHLHHVWFHHGLTFYMYMLFESCSSKWLGKKDMILEY